MFNLNVSNLWLAAVLYCDKQITVGNILCSFVNLKCTSLWRYNITQVVFFSSALFESGLYF